MSRAITKLVQIRPGDLCGCSDVFLAITSASSAYESQTLALFIDGDMLPISSAIDKRDIRARP